MSKLIKAFKISLCDYVGYTWENIKVHSIENNQLIYSKGNKRDRYLLKENSRVFIVKDWIEKEEIENNLYEVKIENGFKTISFTPFSADIKDIKKRIDFFEKLKNKEIIFKNCDVEEHLKNMLAKKETVHFDDEFNYQLVDINNEILKEKDENGNILNHETFLKLLEKYKIEITGKEKSTSVRPELNGRPYLKSFIGPMWNGNNIIRYETSKTYEVMSN